MLISRLRGKRAFTLIELLIVITVIAILSVAFLPRAFDAPRKARDTVKKKVVQDIQASVEAKLLEGAIPVSEADFCLKEIARGNIGLQTIPIDSAKKKSCIAAVPADANDDKYFYKADADYYVIAVITELDANANATRTLAELQAVGTLDAAKALLAPPVGVPVADAKKYYIVVGPS